ncbi:MAG: FmdE family protein [Elusimicrobiales bacterium]|jgi:formylmethanofuran dehydrogenase subunit E|nr:FmdE family protein [Elusimicrobiales bacterium]HOL63453.1 FmdE family protein [Elusimicrobiales bacterium]HPO95932.1 FmdE family protein [Elusimicrobiales bacterium]
MKDLKRCVEYHGHKCMGLLMGYRAAKYALKILKEQTAKDEEIVSIVENSSCFVDAVSVITGCTFGKGNLIFKDYGKMALSLISRKNGKGIRVYLRSENLKRDKKDIELMNRVLAGKASKKEISIFNEMKKNREKEFMKIKDEELFKVYDFKGEIPPKAKIYNSVKCDKCKELVMETRIKDVKGKKICTSCLNG